MSNSKNIDDKALVSLLKNGDIDAFDELYWKYQRAIYQNAFRITRDESNAQDIVQEVFIVLWEKRYSVDPELHLAGWLFVSSYNRSVNILKKKLHESLVLDQLINEEAGIENDPGILEQQLIILDKAIGLLSPQKQRVFELCKLQGKSYEEAAKEMQISKHTVKEYLTEAVTRVKEFARQHPVFSLALTSGIILEFF